MKRLAFAFAFLCSVLTVQAAEAATASIAPTSTTFADTAVGAFSTATTFTITNTDAAGTVAISGVSLTDPTNFTVTTDNCTGVTLPALAGNTCTIDVQFNPTAAGGHTGSLEVTTDATDGNIKIASLEGTGTPNATVQFSQPFYSINEAGAPTATLTVTRTGDTTSSFTVAYTVAPIAPATGADIGAVTPASPLAFGSGVTSLTINVPIIDDVIIEPTETFLASLGAITPVTGPAPVLGTTSTAILAIQDDDSPPSPGEIAFNPTNYVVSETVGTFDICITRSNGSDGSVDVDFTVLDGTAAGIGIDFTLASGTETFLAGDTVQCQTVSVTFDTLVEASETFTVVLSNPTGGATLGSDSVVTVTIIDNDAATPTVAFDSASYSVGEADGSVTLTLVRSGDLSTDFDVDVATYDGTAVDPTEYTGSTTTVNFAPGEIIKTVAITLAADDATAEPTLSFFANLENLMSNVGLTGIGAPSFVPVNILDDDGPTTFGMGALTYFFGEGTIAQLVTVNRSGDTSNTDTVDLTATGVTATLGGVDAGVTPTGTLSFAPGETSKNILVTLVGDASVEGNETFTLTLSVPSAGTTVDPLFDESTVTIVDDDGSAVIQLSAPIYTIGESAGVVHVIATRSGNTATAVSATVDTTNDTATAGTDYTAIAAGPVSFAAGEIAKSIPVTISPDATVEGNEIFNITLSAPVGAVLGVQQSSSVVIVDDDGASTIQFAQPTYIFSEGGVSGIVVVTRSGSPNGTVGATVTETDLTALDTTDFTLSPASPAVLSFGPGEIAKTITVSLIDDAFVESTETFRLTLSAPTGGASIGANIISEVSILDNEGQATIQFGQANYVVSEGIGTFAAIVTRSGDTSTAVSVDVIPVDVTAVNGGAPDDYDLANPTSVSFSAGETTQTVSIDIFDDSTIEQTESFLLTFDAGSLSSGAVLGPVSTSQVDIVDNDGNATVEFKKDLYSFSEGLGQGVVFAIRSGDASQSVTVPITATDVTATGGGTDYDMTTPSLTFGVGESVKTLLVDLTDDFDIEPTESLLLEIGAPTVGSAILGVNSIAEVDILDNDGASTFNIEKADYVIGEGGGTLAVIVTRSGSTAVSQDVDVDTLDVSALAGTDYTDISTTTLTFGVGVTTQTVLVPILEDTDVESSETFTIALSNPTDGALLGLQSTSLATIVDNDGDATVEFNPASYAFSEGLGIVTMKVIRSGDSSSLVTVPFAVAPVSAATPADFSVTTASPLVFGVGVTSLTVTVTLVDDVLIEPTESFVVTLSPPTTGSAVLGVNSSAQVDIIDNDGDATIEFSESFYSFDEGAGTVTVLAIRSGDSSGAVGASFAAVDVSATAADYAVTTLSPLAFAAFETTKTVTITLTDDTEVEETETFNLILSAPTGGAILGSNSTAEVAIDDNDNAGILAFSSDAFAFNENIGTALITVTRTGGSDGAVSVDCSTINGTATAPADFTALSGATISWSDGDTAPKACSVTIADDILEEDVESFTVTLSDATGDAVVGSVNVATVQIVDNDDPGEIAFSDDIYEVEEGAGSLTVTVLRKVGTTGTVTVEYETVPGTATSPDDFESTSGTLTWGDGDNSPRVISIPIGDTDTETLKVFSVVLSAPTGGASLGEPGVAEVRIGFGAPTVPSSTDGGGCSLATASHETSTAPAWLMLAAALSLAMFRTLGRRRIATALRATAMIALSSVFLMAGGSTGCNKKPLVPEEAVQALDRFVTEALEFLGSFDSIESCAALNQAVDDLNADQVIDCDSGEVQVQALVTECTDGPFSGTGALVAVAQNCVDTSDGTTLDGTVTYTIHTDGTNDVTFSSAGVTVNGTNYPVGGVTVTTSGGATTCSGSFTVLDRPCTVTPDCSTCEFLD